MSNSTVWTIDKTLSSATSLGQCEPGSNDNEEVLQIPALLEPHHLIA